MKSAGVTHTQLAAALGVHKSTVTYWTTGGGAEASKLALIAVITKTTTDYLLGVDLLREEEPPQPVDLAVAASGDIPLSWSGRPLTSVDRRRAFAVLRGLLASVAELGEISQNAKDQSDHSANPVRHRAQSLADIPAKRPRTKGRSRGEDGVGRHGPLDGSHQ